MAKVSIVIPCYNGGAMVQGAVATALAQTHADLEVIVVDDGSTDQTTTAAIDEIALSGRVRVVRQSNAGLCMARNRGIEEASGDYILPLDNDDEIYPTYAAQAAAVLDARREVGIVYSRAERFGTSTYEWHLLEFSLGRMLTQNLIPHCAMYRRDDWVTTGGYSPELRRGYEDHDFWVKILALGREVVRLDEILYRYRDTEGSLVKAMTPEDRQAAFAHTFSNNSSLYVEHATEFAQQVLGQHDMLAHFKRRYGRIEDAISKAGALRRRARKVVGRA